MQCLAQCLVGRQQCLAPSHRLPRCWPTSDAPQWRPHPWWWLHPEQRPQTPAPFLGAQDRCRISQPLAALVCSVAQGWGPGRKILKSLFRLFSHGSSQTACLVRSRMRGQPNVQYRSETTCTVSASFVYKIH